MLIEVIYDTSISAQIPKYTNPETCTIAVPKTTRRGRGGGLDWEMTIKLPDMALGISTHRRMQCSDKRCIHALDALELVA